MKQFEKLKRPETRNLLTRRQGLVELRSQHLQMSDALHIEFPLWPPAYLCELCVEMAPLTQRSQRYAEDTEMID